MPYSNNNKVGKRVQKDNVIVWSCFRIGSFGALVLLIVLPSKVNMSILYKADKPRHEFFG